MSRTIETAAGPVVVSSAFAELMHARKSMGLQRFDELFNRTFARRHSDEKLLEMREKIARYDATMKAG